MRSGVRGLVVVAVVALVAAACDRDGGGREEAVAHPSDASPTGSPVIETGSPSPEPTPPAVPERAPAKRGRPFAGCVEGWRAPAPGTADYTDPIGIIRRTSPFPGPYEVVDVRLFVGPESPPSVGDTAKGYLQDIRRWYVKLYAPDDLAYQGRFLIEQRLFGWGLVAVAPYDTRGFRSPDWIGFQWDSSQPEAAAYPGLPGTWSGEPYDFVNGGEGLAIPGLPDEVRGCLTGT